MSCKKGGFVTDARDLTTKILSEICCDTKIELKLVSLSGEDLTNWTANRPWCSSTWFLEKRTASIFWFNGVQTQSLPIPHQTAATLSYIRKWEEHDIQWKSTTSRPWHIYTMGFPYLQNLPKSVVANRVKLKICFALLKSSLLCLRPSKHFLFSKTSST